MINDDYNKRGILFPIRIFSADDISFYRKEFERVDGNVQLDKKNGKSTDRHFDLLMDNAHRLAAGEPLRNVVDKAQWY